MHLSCRRGGLAKQTESAALGVAPGRFRRFGLSSGFSGTLVLISRIFDPLGGSGKPAFPKLRFLQPLPIEIGHSPGNVAPVPTRPATGSASLMPPRFHIFPFFRENRAGRAIRVQTSTSENLLFFPIRLGSSFLRFWLDFTSRKPPKMEQKLTPNQPEIGKMYRKAFFLRPSLFSSILD